MYRTDEPPIREMMGIPSIGVKFRLVLMAQDASGKDYETSGVLNGT